MPVLLTGYGGFAISTKPKFDVAQTVLLANLGALVAIPGIRGGSEFGDSWHLDAIKDKKQNSFDDFIAAAEYLI